jgi:integrase
LSFRAARRDEGRSNVTINRDLAFLKHFFTMAIKWELVGGNPVKDVVMLKEGKRTRYLTKEESVRLLNACEPYLQDLVIAAIHTGCRPEELLSLTWGNVDFEHRVVTVQWSYSKSHETRSIAMNETLTHTLQGIRLKTPDASPGAPVFRNSRGHPYRSPRTAFETALRWAEIEDFTFYDLRHTFGSWLIMAGEDIRTVKELMGHRYITMTDRYTHLSQRHLRAAVEKLGPHIGPHTANHPNGGARGNRDRQDVEG